MNNLIFEILDKLELILGVLFLLVFLYIWSMTSKERYGKKGIFYPILFLVFIIFAFVFVLNICESNMVLGVVLLIPYAALVVFFADKLFG